ncbi:MAG: hypothetical protein EOP14_07910 [Pseudomonas sp.]|nr:MAG: hypothetical protein EOP14_07910 [Pseudomonas sp.]
MKAYSQDLRERIVSCCQSGRSVAEVASLFQVSEVAVRKYLRLVESGASLAVGRSPGKPRRLRSEQEAEFVALMEEGSDWTLEKLGHEWHQRSGVMLPRSTLHDHVKRLQGRYKKESSGTGTV